MNKFQIDNLLLVDRVTPTATDFSVTEIQGLESPLMRLQYFDNPGRDGGTVGALQYGSRTIVVRGEVYNSSSTTFLADRRSLAYACRLQRDTSGYPVLTRLKFTSLDGTDYFVDAAVKDFKNPFQQPSWSEFQVTFVAPSSAILGTTLRTTGQMTVPVGGGFTFPATFPITFGPGSGGTGALTNNGNMDTWPMIYLRGALTNPYLYSVERQKFLKLNYTTSNTTDVITIDMNQRTIILNGTTNILTAKDDTADWFSLPPGACNFLFSTGSSGDTGTAEVTAYDAYMGV